MHQHQIDTVRHRNDCRAREHYQHQRKPQPSRWNKGAWWVRACLPIALLCTLALSGCSSSDSGVAVAQQVALLQNKRIETFLIDAASFVLNTDNLPTVEVKDSATVYVMQSSGDVSFEELGGSVVTLDLKINDLVIERPHAGTVTVMRDQ